ncbi:hypothetical protein XANCAGTX0491_004961 [Xanthoria calcicola]
MTGGKEVGGEDRKHRTATAKGAEVHEKPCPTFASSVLAVRKGLKVRTPTWTSPHKQPGQARRLSSPHPPYQPLPNNNRLAMSERVAIVLDRTSQERTWTPVRMPRLLCDSWR